MGGTDTLTHDLEYDDHRRINAIHITGPRTVLPDLTYTYDAYGEAAIFDRNGRPRSFFLPSATVTFSPAAAERSRRLIACAG